MSDAGSGEENISLYWKNFFEKRPELLSLRSNEDAIAQWKADHNGEDVPRNAMNGLTNVKSQLRKKSGAGIKKKRGRPRKHPLATVAVPPAARTAKAPAKVLEALEDQIDKCLGLTAGHEELAKITLVLKQARRFAILLMAD